MTEDNQVILGSQKSVREFQEFSRMKMNQYSSNLMRNLRHRYRKKSRHLIGSHPCLFSSLEVSKSS